MSSLLYTSEINKVRFSLSGSETVLKDSYAKINSHDLFRNNEPYKGGVYDAHLGTTDHSYKCQTCSNTKANCLGHEGHIELNYPVFSPIAKNEIPKWLKLICFDCGHPIVPEKDYMKFSRSKRLNEASKLARPSTGARRCQNCKEIHPIVKRPDVKQPLVLIAEWTEDKRKLREMKLYPHIVKAILSRVTVETVIKLGKHPSSHPSHFVLDRIKVPPTPIRPDVKKMGGGRSTNDDLTTLLQSIIKKNNEIDPILPPAIDLKLEKAITELSSTYYDFVRASGENAPTSLAMRMRGKQGRFRRNQLGKRVRNMCRSTISGNPKLKLNEIGIPLVFAKTIQIEETVQEYNRARIMTYVNNGRNKYPGCTKIVKKSTGTEHEIEYLQDEIENGDIIYRDVITGDSVNFNRQPSLMPSNITTLRVVVCEDPTIITEQFNVILCPFN